MTHSETLSHFTDALAIVNRWAAPLNGHLFALHSDGLSVACDSDPSVDGWSEILATTSPEVGALMTALLTTDAVQHLRQTLLTAIELTEAGIDRDPALNLGSRNAAAVFTIAKTLTSELQRQHAVTTDTAATADHFFERFLSDGQPSWPDIDRNFERETRDQVLQRLRGPDADTNLVRR